MHSGATCFTHRLHQAGLRLNGRKRHGLRGRSQGHGERKSGSECLDHGISPLLVERTRSQTRIDAGGSIQINQISAPAKACGGAR
jgi:hypothetical protein